jgi:hypothetical protein
MLDLCLGVVSTGLRKCCDVCDACNIDGGSLEEQAK